MENDAISMLFGKASLKFKLILGGIALVSIFVIFLCCLFDIDAGADGYSSSTSFSNIGLSNPLWWPVGSNETTTKNGAIYASGDPAVIDVVSNYGYRTINGKQGYHSGIDIAKDQKVDYYNVIAAADGKVFQSGDGCSTYGAYKDGNLSNCGGGWGNYVIIEHSNNVYTIYAHMSQGSVKVKTGEAVKQGQVIGKIGSSGNSTGPHLHFQIDVGGYDNSDAVNPLTYVNPSNPRPKATATASNQQLINFISGEEGGPKNSSKTKYVVYCNPGDPPTVGRGITLEYNVSLFKKYGINLSPPYNKYCKKEMDINVLDQIYLERLYKDMDSVKGTLSKNNINNLNQNQINALTSLHYNTGNLNGFVDAYKQYGSTDTLCTNWWQNHYINKGTIYESGLKARRTRECNLFVHGVY